MKLKVYLVSQAVDPDDDSKGEVPIAARLTFRAARAIAKLDGGRRVRLFMATKSFEPDDNGSTKGSSHHGDQGANINSDVPVRFTDR